MRMNVPNPVAIALYKSWAEEEGIVGNWSALSTEESRKWERIAEGFCLESDVIDGVMEDWLV